MTSILLAQEICELDTFTLEEKIQEIEALSDYSSYALILKMAKIQLIERLEVEEFGRKLANDEFVLEDEIKLPLINQPKPNPIKNISYFKNKKQFLQKMQQNIISSVSYVTIGRPAVAHHYKPKVKKQVPEKQKYISQTKNKDMAKTNNKNGKKEPKQVEKKEVALVKNYETLQEHKIDKNEIAINQMSLVQKLKKEVKQMNITYHENDAYDDMVLIKLSPQNLIEEAKLIEDNQSLKFDTCSLDHNELMSQNKTHTINLSENEQKEVIISPFEQIKKQQEQLEKYCTITTNQFSDFVTERIQVVQQPLEQFDYSIKLQSSQSRNSRLIINQAEVITEVTKIQNLNLDKLDKSSKGQIKQDNGLIGTGRQLKSKSVKALINRETLKSKKQMDNHKELDTYQNIHSLPSVPINILNKQSSKSKVTQIIKVMSVSSNNFKNQIKASNIQKPNYFPYNQFIPTFAKLFPHNKNLLNTLRNVEQQLKSHFSKNVFDKSKSNEYLKLNEGEITFKVISQCQQARRHSSIFNIDLQSFYKRGNVMLERIKDIIMIEKENQMLLYRVVRTKQDVYDIISSSFHRTEDWYELPHGLELKTSWNLLWTWSKPQIDFSDLFYFQKVNHFIGNKQIARKDLLKKNIQKIQKLSAKMKNYFDIIPQTYLLPGQNIQFIKKFRQYSIKEQHNYWILKPVGLSRGRGISLINKLQDIIFAEPIVLQKYISNPLLVKGYKFDMRIYVLVTSMNPLEVFLYRQGFARMSTERYSISQEQIGNKFIHLTNYSIQKDNMQQKKTFQQKIGGSKISLKMLSEKLKQMNIRWENIQKQIEQIVLKSLISCMNVIPQNPNCFELFGYDIFIDSHQKCWLLEVNSSPSLEKDYILDEIIKQQLVDDIIEIVNPVKYDRQRLLEVVERRRKQAEGLKSHINTSNNSVQQLNEDLHYILHGIKLRRYGEIEDHKNFKMIAPSEKYYQIVKVIQQYKINPIIKAQV